ncbi:DUF3299 domain-containing protein [Lutimaribacter marinistellae]|uniref:DUF3299 domain-containing protein n=1 Tax=Lutimaribacter marinistellae TaxID=1820329 RepID=A0ABV7TJ29_9RHOB
MRLFLKTVVAILAAAPLLADTRVIDFDQLPDPAAAAFEDPFQAMGLRSLEELRTVVRLQERLDNENFDTATRERLSALVADAREALTEEGHDIEKLLAARWEVAVLRKRARLATNPLFDGAEVALDGFLIPAEPDPDGASAAYLVSEVGLCSHKPAPPPNQLVRVRYEGSFPSRNLYVPVSVVGTLLNDPSDQTIFLLDGSVRMISMWQLSADKIIANGPFGKTEGDKAARSGIDPLAVVQGSE